MNHIVLFKNLKKKKNEINKLNKIGKSWTTHHAAVEGQCRNFDSRTTLVLERTTLGKLALISSYELSALLPSTVLGSSTNHHAGVDKVKGV